MRRTIAHPIPRATRIPADLQRIVETGFMRPSLPNDTDPEVVCGHTQSTVPGPIPTLPACDPQLASRPMRAFRKAEPLSHPVSGGAHTDRQTVPSIARGCTDARPIRPRPRWVPESETNQPIAA